MATRWRSPPESSAGPMRETLGQADAIEQMFGMLPIGGIRDAVGQERHQHILQHRALRQQMVILKHEADLPATKGCQSGFVERERILPGEPHGARSRRLERTDDREQRALAGAARPDDRQVFARRERQRNAGQDA